MEAIIAPSAASDPRIDDLGCGLPSQRPWRLLGRALKWMLFSVAMAFAIVLVPAAADGVWGGIQAGRGVTPDTPMDYAKLAPYASLALQMMLLWGAVRGARVAADGRIADGLANRRVRRRPLVALFALLILGWDAASVCMLSWIVAHGGQVPVVPTEIARMPHSVGAAVLRIAFLALIAPVAEELFFRGWLWSGLRKSWSPAWTLTATSGLWLAMHAVDGTFRPLILLPTGILLGLARHYGDSVRASLMLHLINNGLVVGLQIVVLLAGGLLTGEGWFP